jgi:hypothetical protein
MIKIKGLRIKPSFTNISLIILVLVYILYSTIYQGNSLSCTTLTSYKASDSDTKFAPQISHDCCSLSLKESDNWFCEFDGDWERRKHLHRIQNQRNRNSDSITAFFINNWEPTIHCAFEKRIGSLGDGGKWVCDIHNLQTNNSVPLIYSFGSGGNFGFEEAILKELPNAEIHTFDAQNTLCPKNVCTFHQALLGDGKRSGTKSLHTVIDELGHRERQIDILKIDIEGSEYILFEEFFTRKQNTSKDIDSKHNGNEIPYIRQILVEIHLRHLLGNETSGSAHRLFELFRSNNYAIFHKEPNLYVPNVATEYAFIRLNQAFFIS